MPTHLLVSKVLTELPSGPSLRKKGTGRLTGLMPPPAKMVLDRNQRSEACEDGGGANHQVIAQAKLPGDADLGVNPRSHDEQSEKDHRPYYS